MSGENGNDTAAPAAPQQPQQPAAVQPPVNAQPPAQAPAAQASQQQTTQQDNGEPPWLPDRLARAKEQERKAFLAELGVDDPQKAKSFIEAGLKAEDEKKSLVDRLSETTTQLASQKTEAERVKAVNAAWAERQMSSLTDQQQASIKSAIQGMGLNPEDPTLQLAQISAMSPLWGATQTAAPATAQQPSAPQTPNAQPPATPATGTAPNRTAPADGAPASPPNHQEVYQQLLTRNPFEAAQYALQHVQDVFPDTNQ